MGRVEFGGSVFKGSYRSDERAQPSVSQPTLQFDQTDAIGLDDEEHGADVVGWTRRRLCDTDQRSTRTDQCR